MRVLVRFAGMWCALFLSFAASAQSDQGFYFGASLHRSSIRGGFNGTTLFTSDTSSDASIAPEIEPGQGFGVFAGAHMNPVFDLELRYQKSEHDSEWIRADGRVFNRSVEYSELVVNGRVNFIPKSIVRPVVFVGYGTSWLTVDKGASNSSGFQDATYTGTGLTFGAGINYLVGENLSLGADLSRRFVNFNAVEIANAQRFTLSNTLDSQVTTLSLFVIYHIFE